MSFEEAWEERLEEDELDSFCSQFFRCSRSKEAEAAGGIPEKADLDPLLGLARADVDEFLADIIRDEDELLEIDACSCRFAGFQHRPPAFLIGRVQLPIRMSCHKLH